MKPLRLSLFLVVFFIVGLFTIPHFMTTSAQTCNNDVEPINILQKNLTLSIDAYTNSINEISEIQIFCAAIGFKWQIPNIIDGGKGKVKLQIKDTDDIRSTGCFSVNQFDQAIWPDTATIKVIGTGGHIKCQKPLQIVHKWPGTPCRIAIEPNPPAGDQKYKVSLYDLPAGSNVTELTLEKNIGSTTFQPWPTVAKLKTNQPTQKDIEMSAENGNAKVTLGVSGVVNGIKYDNYKSDPICQVDFIVGVTGLPEEGASGPGFIDICKFAGSNSGECYKCFAIPGVYTAFGCIETDPQKFIEKILKIAMGIAGGIAFLMIVYGGFTIMTSSGNPERLTQGKEIVTSAIAGLLLIVFSVILLKIIGVDILQIPGLGG